MHVVRDRADRIDPRPTTRRILLRAQAGTRNRASGARPTRGIPSSPTAGAAAGTTALTSRCCQPSTAAGTASSTPTGRVESGQQPENRGQPPAPCPQADEGEGGQRHEGRFRVAHHEHERGRREIHQPHGTPREITIVALLHHQRVHREAECERRHVRDEQHPEARRRPRQPRHDPRRASGTTGRTASPPTRLRCSRGARCRGTTPRPTRAGRRASVREPVLDARW